MVKLVETLSRLSKKRVMLIGDLMLDTYTVGKVKRISPEAPVSVLQVTKEEQRPGGAGNVALNLLALGIEVVLLGRIGNDIASEKLCRALRDEGIDPCHLAQQEGFQTPVKNRIIAENQQMMRVDFEKNIPLDVGLEKVLLQMVAEHIKSVEVVAISDYAKGLLTASFLKGIFALTKEAAVPVIVDPKGIDFSKYKGASIIKPNLGEAIQASGLASDMPLEIIAEKLLQETEAEAFFITRSEDGISLFCRGKSRMDFPVRVREVKDVTGAGDTVLAMLATGVANGFNLEQTTALANIAAGIAIEHFGCAKVTLAQVARRLLHLDVTNKIFDEEHLFALRMTIIDRPFTVLSVDGSKGLTSSIFKSIQKLSSDKEKDLVVYINDGLENEEFLSLLASLQEVDFIVLKKDCLNRLYEELKPQDMYILNQNDLMRSNGI